MENKIQCSVCNQIKNASQFVKKKNNSLFYVCKACQKDRNRKYKDNQINQNSLLFLLKKRLYDARNRAERNNLFFNLDLEFMIDLWNKQNGKCALTGLQMTTDQHGRLNTNISIDRIDSSKGYTKDNVQFVCSAVNFMKAKMDINDFIFFCKEVFKYNINKI